MGASNGENDGPIRVKHGATEGGPIRRDKCDRSQLALTLSHLTPTHHDPFHLLLTHIYRVSSPENESMVLVHVGGIDRLLVFFLFCPKGWGPSSYY